MSKDLMIDLETLGTTGDAVILSIGAVKFDIEKGTIEKDGFDRSVSVESNLALRRRISEDTLIWWFKQEAAARQVFFEPKEHITDSLAHFADWLAKDDNFMWSNGADFDLPMLAHAYVSLGMEVPWKFWNSRCFRTYKNLPGAKNIRGPEMGIKHNAMADALTQAQTLCAIHHTLFIQPHVGKTTKAKA